MPDTSALISAHALADRLDDPDLRIADVRWVLGDRARGRADYDAGHVPGAIFVDLDRDLAASEGPGRHPLPDPATFARRLGRLGFGSDHRIVAYDDAFGTIAARLWWMLDNLGHERVTVLDGGLKAWRDAGLPLSTDPGHAAGASLTLRNAWTHVVDREELRERLGSVTLVDARAAERYRGETEPVDPRAGHIPGAVSAPAKTLLRPDGRLLPPEELAARLDAVAAPDRTVVSSCGSGVTACHTALAFRVAGRPDAILYPGSFSDWSRTDLPIATGDEPGPTRT